MNTVFDHIPREQFNDWKWQVANRIETLEDLKIHTAHTRGGSRRKGVS